MSTRVVFLFGSVFMHILVLSIAQPEFDLYDCSQDAGTYTTGSQYQRNLKAVFSSIFNDIVDYGFYNESSGEGADKVYATALCRGDVSTDVCRACIRTASWKTTEICSNKKQAFGWYDECMLRYANKPIFGMRDTETSWTLRWSLDSVVDNLGEYQRKLEKLLFNLSEAAAEGDSRRKFAYGTTEASFQTIYALVQCTPDLKKKECNDCLRDAINQVNGCCETSLRTKVAIPSCNIRVSNFRFFKAPAPNTESPASPPKGKIKVIASGYSRTFRMLSVEDTAQVAGPNCNIVE